MKKLFLLPFILGILLVTNIFGQAGYTVEKMEDIGKGFEAKYITHLDNRKSVLVKFSEEALSTDEGFSEGIMFSLEKIMGKEFCRNCTVDTSTAVVFGIPYWYMKSLNWAVTIKPLINNYEEKRIIGIEILPVKLGVDL